MYKLLSCLLMVSVAIAASAQSVTKSYSTIAGFQYRETIQGKTAPGASLPLLIAFHYSSGNPEETLADYDSLTTPVRIIIPRGNNPKREGYSYYPAGYYKEDSGTQVKLGKQTVDSIAAFVAAIEKKYHTKAIVSGISQGGDIALLLAIWYPQLCKASFPFAGFVHRTLFPVIRRLSVSKVPVYIFQGEEDPIVNVSYIRNEVKQLAPVLHLKLFTYPGVKHEISAAMKKDYTTLIETWLKK